MAQPFIKKLTQNELQSDTKWRGAYLMPKFRNPLGYQNQQSYIIGKSLLLKR